MALFLLVLAQFLYFYKRPKQIDLKIVSADKGHIISATFSVKNNEEFRVSSYEHGNRAGSVTGMNFAVCSYGKSQPGGRPG